MKSRKLVCGLLDLVCALLPRFIFKKDLKKKAFLAFIFNRKLVCGLLDLVCALRTRSIFEKTGKKRVFKLLFWSFRACMWSAYAPGKLSESFLKEIGSFNDIMISSCCFFETKKFQYVGPKDKLRGHLSCRKMCI